MRIRSLLAFVISLCLTFAFVPDKTSKIELANNLINEIISTNK